MNTSIRPGRWASVLFGLLFPITVYAENLWEGTFGQTSFQEARTRHGEVLAGTAWEPSLTPGVTYRISFDVEALRGRMGVLVGDNSVARITAAGRYAYDFSISDTGKRRMLFKTLSRNAAATVSSISVTQSGATSLAAAGARSPAGHYVSFDRARNLKVEMQNIIDNPSTAKTQYRLKIAEKLHDAIRTPGVKGIWMEFPWGSLETKDGKYDWTVLDANLSVARRHGLKFIVKVTDRSFNGTSVLPSYFPGEYVLNIPGGLIAKRWDPYVYQRLIRLHKAIAVRYAKHIGFGGIATAETATGDFSGGDYTLEAYRTSLTQVVTQTQTALRNGDLFFYLNFLRDGDRSDMNKDARVSLVRGLPHDALVIGAPDITPDVKGMPRSATAYRIHVRKNHPSLRQFCHLQHVDLGHKAINVKNNVHRQAYLDEIAAVRERESQSWFSGAPAVFELDDLRDPDGNRVTLHPAGVLGELWRPHELFSFGRRNFACDYVLWHYRDPDYVDSSQFSWPDVQQVILENQYL